ncbi:Rv3235 family protein [Cellulomonas composti]|uniref:3-hydroxyacyl-CoA dehydrogenase n=1 Tax=Cellulomonas composti TaxID=266130 RepID=A0A511JAW0_9CELL|nr:Rv3235 family protein [Cellulomonas composti]GEL95130.1 hypothetical protein CCO02nite_17880 [Cellulomonas composti]
MSAATVEPRTALEEEIARRLRDERPRLGPRPGHGPRVRPVVDLEPRAHRLAARGPATTIPRTIGARISVLRAVQEPEEVDDPSAPVLEPDPALDPARIAGTLAHGVVEVLVGRRNAAQLARWVSPGVFDALRARATVSARTLGPRLAGRAPVLRSVRVCPIAPGVVEAAVVVDDGARVRAVALRLEVHRGAWRATVLEVG